MLLNCGAREDSTVPWTTRRSNQSILKEINAEHSLEGLMLKLHHFDHLMWRADSLEKTRMPVKTDGRRWRGQQRVRWLDGITDSMDTSLSKLREMVRHSKVWWAAIYGVAKSQIRLSNWTTKVVLLFCQRDTSIWARDKQDLNRTPSYFYWNKGTGILWKVLGQLSLKEQFQEESSYQAGKMQNLVMQKEVASCIKSLKKRTCLCLSLVHKFSGNENIKRVQKKRCQEPVKLLKSSSDDSLD